MPRDRRRNSEVPTDTQPQFELGDTAEHIEENEGERERRIRERGEGQREDREREEGREPRKGRKESANRRR